MPEKFWVLPCLEDAFGYVVYTEHGKEVYVQVKDGEIVKKSVALSEDQEAYFKNNVLTKN